MSTGCVSVPTSLSGSSERKYPFSLQFEIKKFLLANNRPGWISF